MSKARTLGKIVAAKTKRVVAEVIGDQTLDDEGKAQEERARDESEQSSKIKPFGNLDRLT